MKELVAKYSEFINFPIYLYASKEVDVPVDEAADEAEASDEEEDTVDDEDVADDGEVLSCLVAAAPVILSDVMLLGCSYC